MIAKLQALLPAWPSPFADAAVAPPALAQGFQRQAPESRPQMQMSFAPLVKQAAPAVVNVYGRAARAAAAHSSWTTRSSAVSSGEGGGQERVQQSWAPACSSARRFRGHQPSRHRRDDEGEGCARATAAEFDADVVLRDQRTDLAVLRLKNVGEARISALPLGVPHQIEVGDIVLAIATPSASVRPSHPASSPRSPARRSALSDYQFFIQTGRGHQSGNSGGAARHERPADRHQHGDLLALRRQHGIGFAIPRTWCGSWSRARRRGAATVRRPWFGARLDSLDREKAEALGLDRPSGALVANVVDRSPAARGRPAPWRRHRRRRQPGRRRSGQLRLPLRHQGPERPDVALRGARGKRIIVRSGSSWRPRPGRGSR